MPIIVLLKLLVLLAVPVSRRLVDLFFINHSYSQQSYLVRAPPNESG